VHHAAQAHLQYVPGDQEHDYEGEEQDVKPQHLAEVEHVEDPTEAD
jgi:hypothetical protein